MAMRDLTTGERSRFNAVLSGRGIARRYALVRDDAEDGMEVVTTDDRAEELLPEIQGDRILIDKEEMKAL